MSDAMQNSDQDDVLNAIRKLVQETHSERGQEPAPAAPVQPARVQSTEPQAPQRPVPQAETTGSGQRMFEMPSRASLQDAQAPDQPAAAPQRPEQVTNFKTMAQQPAALVLTPDFRVKSRQEPQEPVVDVAEPLRPEPLQPEPVHPEPQMAERHEPAAQAPAPEEAFPSRVTLGASQPPADNETLDSSLRARISELEATLGTEALKRSLSEPQDDAVSEDMSQTLKASVLDHEAEYSDGDIVDVAPEPQHDVDDLGQAGFVQGFDEASLREMVTEVMREELQGQMGERITRNMRRLIRREVQRALTLKDFE